VLGFFGTDHFYLRSFGTGVQKLIFNIFSLGFWWWWDVLQIVTDSNKVKAEGLNTPFDWVRGVGRGVFEDPVKKAEALENGGKIVRVKKDLFVYALLTMILGICGADKFYIGETYQGIAKLLSVFNIFTFLFGLAWVIWDIVNVLFYTESLVKNGISPPPPFTWLFPEPIKAEPLFMPEEVSKEQLEKESAKEAPVGGFPILGMDTFRFWYKELAVPLLQPTVGTAVKTADKTVQLGEKAAAVGGEVLAAGPKVASAVTSSIASALNPAVIMEQVQQAAADKAASRIGVQAGGGLTGRDGESSGPIVAGTLLAVVLAGAGKFVYDIVNKQ
jgi:TM2 domain-containing membrane protein YozV